MCALISNKPFTSLAFVSIIFSVLTLGCSPEHDASPEQGTASADESGPYFAANTTLAAEDPTRNRSLVIEVWYPSHDPLLEPLSPIDFEATQGAREALREAYESAASCPTRITHSQRDATLIQTNSPLPLILFSHCLNCGRYATFSLAERLATHGFVVLSTDHAGPLPFLQSEPSEMLSPLQLRTRVEDLRVVLEQAINGTLFARSNVLNTLRVEPTEVGIYGHSFGSVTAGAFAMDEAKVSALAGLGAPMANPLFPSIQMEALSVPTLLMLAEEDNSISEVGNRLLRENYDAANTPIWRVDIADAGHWSFSDLCGLTESFSAGCGFGNRHSQRGAGESFEYLPLAEGIMITQNYLTAFFLAHLMDRQDAHSYLRSEPANEHVTVYRRP